MPTPTPRPSLTTDLETRYETQPEGGAFDAKKAGTPTAPPSLLAQQFDNTNKFVVKEPLFVSNFKGANGTNYTEISSLAVGIDTRKYSATNPS